MGIFRDIVRNSKNEKKVFKWGLSSNSRDEDVECVVEFVEKRGEFEPTVESVTLKFTDGKIVVKASDEQGLKPHLTSYDEKENEYHLICGSYAFGDRWPSYLFTFGLLGEQSEGQIALKEFLEAKEESIGGNIFPTWMRLGSTAVFSIAPIRSRPERTYDATSVSDDPEGSEVPMHLMLIQATKKKRWEELKHELNQFGRCSGMFQNIEVKNLASPGGPFQLKVKVRGPNSNIIDVGYGVSQIMPILVQILDPPSSRAPVTEIPFFLLQQPEVHLHPESASRTLLLAGDFGGQRQALFPH